jgi:hypothetical protein
MCSSFLESVQDIQMKNEISLYEIDKSIRNIKTSLNERVAELER